MLAASPLRDDMLQDSCTFKERKVLEGTVCPQYSSLMSRMHVQQIWGYSWSDDEKEVDGFLATRQLWCDGIYVRMGRITKPEMR
jgi:hypothetical protein